MKVTFADQSHIHNLEAIVRATFHSACPEDSSGRAQAMYIDSHLAAKEFAQWLGSNRHKVWVALVAQQPVGFAVIENVLGDMAKLSKLYVLPDFQGKGIALGLHKAVLGYVKGLGIKKLCLSVYSGNLKAKSFYKKQGYRFLKECDFIMGAEIHKDYIYELSLV